MKRSLSSDGQTERFYSFKKQNRKYSIHGAPPPSLTTFFFFLSFRSPLSVSFFPSLSLWLCSLWSPYVHTHIPLNNISWESCVPFWNLFRSFFIVLGVEVASSAGLLLLFCRCSSLQRHIRKCRTYAFVLSSEPARDGILLTHWQTFMNLCAWAWDMKTCLSSMNHINDLWSFQFTHIRTYARMASLHFAGLMVTRVIFD